MDKTFELKLHEHDLRISEHDKRLKEYGDVLKDHGDRLDKVEISIAEFRVQMQNLCESLNNLTGWIKKLVFTILGTLTGFVLWCIQFLISKGG